MKRIALIVCLPILMTLHLSAFAQFDPKGICRIENDQLIFRLDKQWTDDQKKEVSRLFDLDSNLLARVFDGNPFIELDSVTWAVKVLHPGIVEISKMLAPPPPKIEKPGKEYILFDFWSDEMRPSPPPPAVPFGVNRFKLKQSFDYQEGIATFFLPGFKEKNKVYISGSFNNWSTMESPMTRTDSGWIFRIPLPAGRYSYKFILDGKWSPDPNNRQEEDDTYGSHNSVVFCYNYRFVLDGYPGARKVILAGSFNNWNEKELLMQRTATGWELPVYLREGTHAYKFIVDNQWILDPANPVRRSDGIGNENSFMATGDTLVFRLNGFTNAGKVTLAGNFNAWNPDELLMFRETGGWFLPYVLAAGNYEYKFIVDGKWMPDPENPLSTGKRGEDNSVITFKPNYIFHLDSFPEARKVVVSGSFNNWNPGSYQMKWNNGRWEFPLYLAPGKHLYKFVVDDVWIIDPFNPLWEENEYGTHNSVLWLDQ